jgi:predicted MFS family arabinose efflux permease
MLICVTVFKTNIWLLILFYFFMEWGKPFHQIFKLSLVHRETDDAGRITVLSLEESVTKLGDSLGLMGIGFLTQGLPLETAWLLGASLYSISIFGYLGLVKREPN